MATKYSDIDKVLKSVRAGYKTQKSGKSDSSTVDKQIESTKTRLKAGGVNPEKATDKRNFVEKFLNLTPDQNFLFDVFEILGRPQQALFGGIEDAMKGGDFLKGMGKGITGKEYTQGKDILKNLGMSDRKGKLDLVDVLGFAGDVLLDPVDWALIPVSGGTSVAVDAARMGAKGAQIADTAGDVAKGVKTAANILDTGSDIAKAADIAADVAKVGGVAGDIAKGAKAVDTVTDIKKAADVATDVSKLGDLTADMAKAGIKTADGPGVEMIRDIFHGTRKTPGSGLPGAQALRDGFYGALNPNDYATLIGDVKPYTAKLSNVLDLTIPETFPKGLDLTKINLKNLESAEKAISSVESAKVVNQLEKLGKKSGFDKLGDFLKSEGYDAIFSPKSFEGPELAAYDLTKIFDEGGNALEKVKDVAKTFDTAEEAVDLTTDLAKAGGAVKDTENLIDTLETVKNPVQFKSLSSLAFEGMGKAVKGGAKIADMGITKALGMADNAAMNKAIKEGSQYLPKSMLNDYKYVKDWFSRAFNATKNIPTKVMDSFRKNNADAERLAARLGDIRNIVDDDLVKYAENVTKIDGSDVNKVIDQANKDILNLKEYLGRKTSTTNLSDVVKGLEEHSIKYTDEVDRALKELLAGQDEAVRLGLAKPFDLKVDKAGFISKQGPEYKKFKDLVKAQIEVNPNIAIKSPLMYTGDQLKYLDNLEKKLATDANFQTLYNKVSPAFDEANKVIDEVFGTELAQKYAKETGYARHALDNELIDQSKRLKGMGAAENPFLQGNLKAMADRKYKMSVLESNNLWGDTIAQNIQNLSGDAKKFAENNSKLFAESFTKSFDDYLREIPDLAKDMKNIDNVLIKSTFGDWNEMGNIRKQAAQAAKMGDNVLADTLTKKADDMLENSNMRILRNADEAAPPGFVKLADTADVKVKTNFLNKLEKMGNQFDNADMANLAKRLKAEKGIVAIDPNIMRMVGTNWEKEASAFGRMYDKMINMFKKNKVLSPTFQINNAIGNMTNMSLAGVPMASQAIYYPKAVNILSESKDIMDRAIKNGVESLSPKDLKKYQMLEKFNNAGFGSVAEALNLRDMPESLQQYFRTGKVPKNAKEILIDGIPYLNNRMNNYMDKLSRLTMFMAVDENPKLLSKMGVQNAGEAVRRALFDPSELTPFEQKYMKRIIPFYTFTKKNLAFHMSNLGKNGERYHRLMKGYNNLLRAATDGNEQDIASYLKNSMYIPIPGVGKNGNYIMTRATLPFGNLTDIMTSPGEALKSMVSMTSPFVKAPFEFATGASTLTGRPIESFEGQMSKDIPFLTRKQENIIGNVTGLDVPMKQIGRITQGFQGEGSLPDKIGQGLLNTVATQQSVEQDKLYKAYDDLNSLQDLMKKYKQAGYYFATMNELKAANSNNKLDSLMAELNKINGYKSSKGKMIQDLEKQLKSLSQ